MADVNAEFWNSTDVAEYLGVSIGTVSAYNARKQMPAPDLNVGRRTHLWRPATIITWHANRPHAGKGKG